MTVGTKARSVSYQGYGSTGPFPVPFRFLTENSLAVTITPATGDDIPLDFATGYTVAGIDLEGGGSITTRRPILTGEQITIIGNADLSQPLVYVPNDPFPAKQHERALDRAMIAIQELRERVGRGVSFGVGELGYAFKRRLQRASSLFGFDADGRPTAYTFTGLAAALAPPMAGLLASIKKGDPGGNVMAVGLVAALATMSVPAGTDRIRTAGHAATGRGAAELVYDPTITAASPAVAAGWAWMTANGRGFAITADQPLDFTMFGARPEYMSPTNLGYDNSAAWAAMRAFLTAKGDTRWAQYYRYTSLITAPTGSFYFSSPAEIDFGAIGLHGVGLGTTAINGGGGTRFVFAKDKHGIIVGDAQTQGEATRPVSPAGQGSYISGIAVESLGGTPGVAADGFRVRTGCTIDNCIAVGFPRHGFSWIAGLGNGGATEGNANCALVINCTAFRNFIDGFYFQGADANAISALHLNALYNGRIGIHFNQFLACTLAGYHLEGNGHADAGPRTMPQQLGAQCSYGGKLYAIKAGAAADAATVVPGTNADVWGITGTGLPHTVYPLWSPGRPWTEGGALRSLGANADTTITGGYVEPGEPPVSVGGRTLLIGGQQDAGVFGTGFMRQALSRGVTSASFYAYDGQRGAQLGGDPNSSQLMLFELSAGFPWRLVDDGAGGMALTWANIKEGFTIKPSSMEMRIERPVLGSLRVEGAGPAIATGAVARTIEVFDGAGNSLGVLEVKAKA